MLPLYRVPGINLIQMFLLKILHKCEQVLFDICCFHWACIYNYNNDQVIEENMHSPSAPPGSPLLLGVLEVILCNSIFEKYITLLFQVCIL